MAALIALFFVDAAAQDRYVRLARQVEGPGILHESIVLPGSESAQVLVAFRIPNHLLVFVRQDDQFQAEPEVAVRWYRDGRMLGESIWRDTHRAASFEATQDEMSDVEGRILFRVPPGRYEYEVSLGGEATRAGATSRRRSFVVPEFSRDVVGRPFFGHVRAASEGVVQLEPANAGGGVFYGDDVPAVVPLASIQPNDRLAYRLHRTYGDGDRRRAGFDEVEADGPDELLEEGSIAVEDAFTIGALDEDCLCARPGGAGRFVLVDLKTGSLDNGVYRLEVELTREEGSRHAARTVFETYWRGMPLSLHDHVVAIRNLEFIESRDRIREMLRGSRADRIARFQAYWDERDPSPGTPFNELMAEYYRRVDVAAARYRTGKTPLPDGLRTDAARIYIVHGPPDDISNSFPSSGGIQQVWTYPNGRQFVLWAASSLDALELQEERGPSNGS